MIICAFLLQADGYLLVFALDDPDSFNLLTDLVPRWVAAFPRKICHNKVFAGFPSRPPVCWWPTSRIWVCIMK